MVILMTCWLVFIVKKGFGKVTWMGYFDRVFGVRKVVMRLCLDVLGFC